MYPNETVAVMTYGLEMFLVAVTGTVLYWYIAFRGKLLDPAITMKTRKNFYKRSIGGPIMYFVAILISLLSTKISIAFYIIIPLLYVFLPKAELE